MTREEKIAAARQMEWREELRKSMKAKERTDLPRVKMNELDAEYRSHNREEVNQGLTKEQALQEAKRCLDCVNPTCMNGCPVEISIPTFIKNIERGEFLEAAKVLKETSALPAVCGRVCPQESQCEAQCIRGIKGEAVSIGKLERFVADWAKENDVKPEKSAVRTGKKVAVIGSGPSGLTCAGELAKAGVDVTIFEALHEAGGVLVYASSRARRR